MHGQPTIKIGNVSYTMYMNVNEDDKKMRLVSLRHIRLMGKFGIMRKFMGKSK
jgi:hypothetical protein